jgi:hypothetical protein
MLPNLLLLSDIHQKLYAFGKVGHSISLKYFWEFWKIRKVVFVETSPVFEE